MFESYIEAINQKFQFGNVKNVKGRLIKLPKEPYIDFDEHEAEVSFNCNRATYRYKQYYMRDIKNYEQLYEVYNGLLSDQSDSMRLHMVGGAYVTGIAAHKQPKALILLSEEQHKALSAILSSEYRIRFSTESFRNQERKLLSKQLEQLDASGFFAHIPSQTKDSIFISVTEQSLPLPEALLLFPNLTYQFDVEMGNIDNPYEELLLEFARISRGKFNPTQIKDGFDIDKEGKFEVSFLWDGMPYKVDLTVNNDWVDESFESYVNNVVVGNITGHKFFYTPYEFYIFANDEQYRLLESMGLFDWEKY